MKKNYLAQINFEELKKAIPAAPGSLLADPNLTVSQIVSSLLSYLFVLAGLALLVYLILGGFELMTSAGDPEKTKRAKGKITNAIIGFFVIFIAYWLMQVVQTIFGLTGPF